MRPVEDVSAVLELRAQGHSASAIARRTGIPRGTVRDWVSGRTPKRAVHGPGRKHHRRIELVQWQRELVAKYPQLLLRGLVQSDGCRFINTGRKWRHPRYSFSNRSDDIRRIFCDACDLMGLHWTTAVHTVYVSRKADVAVLDRFIGPKA